MRGITALIAAASVWVFVVGVVPMRMIKVPKIRFGIVLAAAGTGIAGAVVAYGLLGVSAPALAIGVLCSAIPIRADHARRARLVAERMSKWPDLIAHARSSVAAGATLPDAFVEACHRLGGEYERIGDSVRLEILYGGGFEPAIRRIRDDLDDGVSDRVLATFMVAQRTGGHRVGDVLAALGSSVADEIRLTRAHEAAMTEQRLTATVALVAPWALLALSIATNPQSAEAFDTVDGMIVVFGGLVATGAGWLLARRASRLGTIPRLFT